MDKTQIGRLGGRVPHHLDLVLDDKLEANLNEIIKETLEKAGYKVLPDAQPVLEGEIQEFWVRANGWTQGATERIRFRLRDKDGQVLWEHGFRGEDGGNDMTTGFAEKSMNVALARLLADAIEEFTSEFFYQSVRKAQAEKP